MHLISRHDLHGWKKQSKITPYLMSYDDKTGKQGRWHKGALTTNFCKWLLRLLKDLPQDDRGLLALCRAGTAKLNAMFSRFFQGGFFLDKAECLYSSSCGLEFLATYCFMAQQMFDIGQPSLFPLYPKLHSMHHMMIRPRAEALEFGFSQNPMSCSCQLDEDVIGRVSRLSRRVSIRTVMWRTLERYLIGCFSVWKDCGLIRYKMCGKSVCWARVRVLLVEATTSTKLKCEEKHC